MSFLETFESSLPEHLQKQLRGLDTPFAIQEYMDSMPYIGEERDLL